MSREQRQKNARKKDAEQFGEFLDLDTAGRNQFLEELRDIAALEAGQARRAKGFYQSQQEDDLDGL